MTATGLLDARPRLRTDAVVGPAQHRGPARVHMVRVGARTLEVGVKEHFLIVRLDGTRSLAEIGVDYQAEFGKGLGPANWGRILGTLQRSGLLAGDPAEQPVARDSGETAAPQPSGRAWGRSIPLVRRPGAMLDAVLRPLRPLLSAWFMVPLLAAILVMEFVLATRLDELTGQAGRVLHRPGALLLVCLATWVAVALHEAAHGLAARRYGVPVLEIGVRWTPPLVTPYCRTDGYLHLPRRRAHVAIAAAGVVVELALLLPVFLVWSRIDPGPTRDTLGAILFFFSLHALFNALPLPPMDGYRMLGHALSLTDYARHTLTFVVLLGRRDPLVARYPSWVRWCYLALAVFWVLTATATLALLVLLGQLLTGSWLWSAVAVLGLAVLGALAARMLARRRVAAPAPAPVPAAPTPGRHRAETPPERTHPMTQTQQHSQDPAEGGSRPAHRTERPVLELTDVVKTYGERRAVDRVTLSVAPGEFLGLLGPNGAGKTTLVEVAVGLRRADGGAVSVLGASPWPRSTAVLSRLGVQTQTAAFFVRLTAREHLRTVAALYGYGPAAAEKALQLVGLEESGDVRAERLSGGQQQRLAIASALVHDPELIFLDEPTASLDPQARRELWAVLRSLHANGRTVVYTTHHLDEAEALCDRVAIIARGRIVALGAPYQLIDEAGLPTRLVVPRQALAPEQAGAVPGVLTATREGPSVVIETHRPEVVRPALEDLVGRSAVQTRTPTLEDVYLDRIGSEDPR
ncbi:ATP-binding cassette domain-containing protein [Nocardioides insulae]|uniref:ATP-binding cassette domain-containing protein n=1 Tax=Nocardioides insulae TaxID=394734 RepID=UPI0004015B9A|nr:ATP-binding cassette domain-containing protein [Nocardioides insulae]